jgi:hypothetical protein
MILWTATYSVSHTARVDITRSGCDRLLRAGQPAPGEFLAPSGDLLRWGLDQRRRAKPDMQDAVWRLYEADYLIEVRERIARDRRPLDALLRREELCAVCFCGGEHAAAGRCHRFPAARLLGEYGAEYRGELREEPTAPRQMDLFGGGR